MLLEAEDDMKSKRISEIQDVLAEKMQDLPLLAAFGAVLVTLVAAAELMPQDLDVLKMELRQKEAEFAVDGLCIIMVWSMVYQFQVVSWKLIRAQKVWEGSRESKLTS